MHASSLSLKKILTVEREISEGESIKIAEEEDYQI